MKNSDQSPEISFAQQAQEKYRAFAREMVVRQEEKRRRQGQKPKARPEVDSRNDPQGIDHESAFSLLDISQAMNPGLNTLSLTDTILCQGEVTLEGLGETVESWKKICKNAGFYSLYMNHGVSEIFNEHYEVDISTREEEDFLGRYSKMFAIKGKMDMEQGPIFEVLGYIMNQQSGEVQCFVKNIYTVKLESVIKAFRETGLTPENHDQYFEVIAKMAESAMSAEMTSELQGLEEEDMRDEAIRLILQETALAATGVNWKQYQQ